MNALWSCQGKKGLGMKGRAEEKEAGMSGEKERMNAEGGNRFYAGQSSLLLTATFVCLLLLSDWVCGLHQANGGYTDSSPYILI